MFDMNIGEWLAAISVFCSLIGGAWYLFRKLSRRATNFLRPYELAVIHVIGDENHEGLVKTVSRLSDDIGGIKKELTPNGGSSVKDQVKQAAQNSVLVLGMIRAREDTDDESGSFQTSVDGAWVWASRSTLRWSGRSMLELIGQGWLTAVHPEDRADVRHEWHTAVEDRREFDHTYRYLAPDGKTATRVRTKAIPLLNDRMEVSGWFGAITLLERIAEPTE